MVLFPGLQDVIFTNINSQHFRHTSDPSISHFSTDRQGGRMFQGSSWTQTCCLLWLTDCGRTSRNSLIFCHSICWHLVHLKSCELVSAVLWVLCKIKLFNLFYFDLESRGKDILLNGCLQFYWIWINPTWNQFRTKSWAWKHDQMLHMNINVMRLTLPDSIRGRLWGEPLSTNRTLKHREIVNITML